MTMNDCFRCFLYGREKQEEILQSILKSSILHCNNGKSLPESDNVKDYYKRKNPASCKSEHTQSTLTTVSNEEQSSVDGSSYDTSNNSGSNNNTSQLDLNDHDNEPCRLVLVSGPAYSAKRAFVNGSILNCGNPINLRSSNWGQQEQQHDHIVAKSREGAVLSSVPFLLVEGLFHDYRTGKLSTDHVKTSLVKNEMSLIAFDDTVREVYDSLQNDSAMLENIRNQLMKTLDNAEIDIQVLTEIYPFMKPWLNLKSTTNASTDFITKDSNTSDKKFPVTGKEIIPNVPSTLLRKILIVQQIHSDCPVSVRFLRAVSNCIPLVIVLEDIHFADDASIAVIEKLLERSTSDNCNQSNGLLLVATYDSETVTYSTAFTSFLQRCKGIVPCFEPEDNNHDVLKLTKCYEANVLNDSLRMQYAIDIRTITIERYTWEDVFAWVHDCDGYIKQCTMDQKRDITSLVLQYSAGKPNFIRFLLLYLELDEFILFSDIKTQRFPANHAELCNILLLRLEPALLDLLKAAAAWAQYCENYIDYNALETSLSQQCTDTINMAQSLGLLEYKPAKRCLVFCCNKVQQAAYNLIPISDRPGCHVDIGRRLWNSAVHTQEQIHRTDMESIYVMLIAIEQFQNHLDHLNNFDECLNMSQLCYEAGKDAAFNRDYYSSSKLFNFAILVLGTSIWKGDLYETSLVLHNAVAQAYCYVGDYVSLQRILDGIFDNSTSFNDTLPAYITLLYSLDIRLRLHDAFITSSVALKELGESINCSPSIFSVIAGFVRMKRLFHGKTEFDLVNLPPTENDLEAAVALLLLFASISSYVVKAEIGLLVGFRILDLAVDKGVSGPSAVAFSTYSFVLCATGNFVEAYRMGQVAVKMVDKYIEWRPRVHVFVYGYTNLWTNPFRDSLEPLQQASHAALIVGDISMYSGGTTYYVLIGLAAGLPLILLERTAKSICKSMDAVGNMNPLLFGLPAWCLLKALTCSDDGLDTTKDVADADTTFQYAIKEGNTYLLGNLYSIRMMQSYLIGNYNEALVMAKKSYKYRKISDWTLSFYEGLATLALSYITKSYLKHRQYRIRGQILARRIKSWAVRCPANFYNKQLLLEAEIAGLKGHTTKALDLFHQSIETSNEQGMIHEVGIANERLGHYHLYLGNVNDAIQYYNNARMAYKQWEATLLVRRMDEILTVTSNKKKI